MPLCQIESGEPSPERPAKEKDVVTSQSEAKPQVTELGVESGFRSGHSQCNLPPLSWEAAKKLQYQLMGHSDVELDKLARWIKDSRKRAGLISR